MKKDHCRSSDLLQVFVVGSGPNGLAAAIEMARAGYPVTVLEGADTVGGGARSAELTLPGFVHDVCSAIHPLAQASPFFSSLLLERHGLEWIQPPLALAHPFDDGSAAVLSRKRAQTCESLGVDADAWESLFAPLVESWDRLLPELLGPPWRLPTHPLLLGRFALSALRSATHFAQSHFQGMRAKSLFAGLAAHSFLPLEKPVSAAFGLILGAAGHVVGWPFPRGGSRKIAEALADCLQEAGGRILTRRQLRSLAESPEDSTVFLDLTPRLVLALDDGRLSPRYRSLLAHFRYGPGACKIDWALSAPIPWKAPECAWAGTVHLGGALEEIAESERKVWNGEHPERPYVILAQQSRFDGTRAPMGRHTGWAYCHVPQGSHRDMSEVVEAQVERFAPGFRDLILARHVRTAAAYEQYNPNFVGGDINGGVQDLRQIVARPAVRNPYATNCPGLYLCSSSTPPGGGVHGMCGYHAARAALRALERSL